MAELIDLPRDIYALFNPDVDHEINEDNLTAFGENIKDLMRQRLKQYVPPSNPLRFSALGRPNRQIWFDAHPEAGTKDTPATGKETLLGKTYLKFMFGDLIEQMLLFLTKEAGHEVTLEQATVEVDGVQGHIDARIDGTIVDVKSASPFGYKKFRENTITQDDPFGYVEQLSGYASVLTPGEDAAWLAMDKVAGDICVTPLSKTVIKYHPPGPRIEELKKVIASEEVPELCYDPVPDGKSGNYKLPTPCSYCGWKHRCHSGLRTFLYSTGPRFLTTVAKTPDVPEIDGKKHLDEQAEDTTA